MAGYPVLLYLITSTKQGLERSVTVTATDRRRLGRTRSVAAEARLSRPSRLVTANLPHSDSRTRLPGALVSRLVGQTQARSDRRREWKSGVSRWYARWTR